MRLQMKGKAWASAIGMAFLATGLVAVPAQAATAVAIWHMDESSGGVMTDSSGNGNNGSLKGAVQQGQSPAVSGSAYRWSGLFGVVVVPTSASLNPGAADISLTVHANFTALPLTDYDLIRKGLSSTSGGDYKMEILSSGKVLCLFRGTTATVKKRASRKQPPINDGRYHTLQCVKTANSVQVLVDGVSYGTSS